MTAFLVYQINGDVTPIAEHEVAAAVAMIRASGNVFAIEVGIWLLAQLHVLQGRLRQAAATYAQVVQEVPHLEVLHTMFTSFYYYFGGETCCASGTSWKPLNSTWCKAWR